MESPNPNDVWGGGNDPQQIPGEASRGEIVQAGAGNLIQQKDDLNRAVIHAASVLETLAANQMALHESVERAERTELLLQNVSGLNDTFRSLAATQAKLLDSVEAADRRREQAERQARRSQALVLIIGILLLSTGAVAFYAIHAAMSGRPPGEDAIASAIQADLREQRANRAHELTQLAASFREALSDRKLYEEKVSALAAREEALRKEIDIKSAGESTAAAELEKTKIELAGVREKLSTYQQRAVEEGEGIQRVMTMLNAKGLSVDALREQLKNGLSQNEQPQNKEGQQSRPQAGSQQNDVNQKPNPAAEARPGSEARPDDESPAAPAAANLTEQLTPIPVPIVNELNALLSYSSTSDLRLVDSAGRVATEMRDAYFTRYNNLGKPSGFVVARKAQIEERQTEPRLVLRMIGGYEISGPTKVPFQEKYIEFRGVDPAEWRRRLPELVSGRVSPDSAAGHTAAIDAIPRQPVDPAIASVIERFNSIFERHPEYVRLKLHEIASIQGEFAEGITMQTFSQDLRTREVRADQTIRARIATFTYVRAARRLEINLEDGTRGRELGVPFPGGKLQLLIPGVDASELEGGESALPIRYK